MSSNEDCKREESNEINQNPVKVSNLNFDYPKSLNLGIVSALVPLNAFEGIGPSLVPLNSFEGIWSCFSTFKCI
jgi:hypothetical protein